MLQTPSDHELRRRTGILPRETLDRRVLHPQGASQGSVNLDGDTMLLAEGGYRRAGVEGVNLDLVDCRIYSRFGRKQSLELNT